MPEQELLTIPETASVLRISRANLYNMVRRGDFPIVKLGARTLVKRSDLETFIASLGYTTGAEDAE